MNARRGWLRHTAWFALLLASCNFESSPIIEDDGMSGEGGSTGTGGDAGRSGEGGRSGGSGAGTGGVSGAGTGGAGMSGRGGTGGRSGTGGGGGSCVPNAFIECDGSAAIRCSDTGRGRVEQDCGAPGCNAEEKRCNVCVPDEKFCDDNNAALSTCGSDGLVASTSACAEGCNNAVSPAVCNQCTPNASFCLDATTRRSCDAQGNAQDDTTCAMGCTNIGNGTAACNTCLPGTVLGCADSSHQLRCNDSGSGTETALCTNGCSGSGVCNVCVPNATSCAGPNTLRTCNGAGTANTDTTCSYGCRTANDTSTCNDCRPSTVECHSDSELVSCSAAGEVQWSQHCPSGCDTAPTPDACRPVLRPSNLGMNTCLITTATDLSVEAGMMRPINTDSAMNCSSSESDVCLMIRRDVLVAAGATLRVTGSRPLALVGLRSLVIAGTIDASADGAMPGPGALSTGPSVGGNATAVPQDGDNTPGNAGGGGGGFGTVGASGGEGAGLCLPPLPLMCSDAGAGGAASSDPNAAAIRPFRGGANGGLNSANAGPRQGAPGAGGGAVQLVLCSAVNPLTIETTAVIDAGGGGGEGGRATSSGPGSPTPGGGAGGGSGGAILIEAQSVSIASGATLVANGGGGGGGATNAMGGHDGENGQDGTRSTLAANGGAPGGGSSLAGGKGGALEAPTKGGDALDNLSAAGGGGGAAGRIRVNDADGWIGDPTLVVSPEHTLGTVMTN